MSDNSNLAKAKEVKNDEFYTQYDDIQAELNHYEKHFKNKIVLCNCDDPVESQFCFYFLKNFNYLRIKRLICTCYKESPVAFTIFDYLKDDFDENVTKHNGYVLDIKSISMKNGRGISDEDIIKLLHSSKVKKLKGDGDFRSDECIEYLKQADIVCTNPPFSLFREYVALLMEHKKKFLIIGNQNSMTCKEIFPLFKNNVMWSGYNNVKSFKKPNGEIQKFGNVEWFTNLDIEKRYEKLILLKKYDKKDYPKYDNYNAINCDKIENIPKDYDGIIGVPITFLDKYNPEQFEIKGFTSGRDEFDEEAYPTKKYINAIQHNPDGTTTSGSKANTRACIENKNPKGVYYTADNCKKKLEIVYARVLIKNKNVEK